MIAARRPLRPAGAAPPHAAASRPPADEDPFVVQHHDRHVGVVHAGLDRLRRLLHQPLGIEDGGDAVRDAAQQADLLGAVLALGLGAAQRLVGPRELARLLDGLRPLVLLLGQPPDDLVLLGAEEDLQPAIEQLVQGDQRFRERVAVGRGRDDGRDQGAVERAHREQDERQARDRRRGVLLVVRLEPLQLALLEPRQQRIDVALGVGADVRRDPGGHLGELTGPGLDQAVPVRLQLRGRLLQGQRERGRHPFLSPM